MFSTYELAKQRHAQRCRRLGYDAEQIEMYWQGCNQEKLIAAEQKRLDKICCPSQQSGAGK